MGEKDSDLKYDRILGLYNRFLRGEIINKEEESNRYHVSPRSIQRDIDALRNYFSESRKNQGETKEIIYDRSLKGYRLNGKPEEVFTVEELFAICKILLESRALQQTELLPVLNKMENCCVDETDRRELHSLIINEKFNYVEPHHGKPVLDSLWKLGKAIHNQNFLEITYGKMGNQGIVQRKVRPVGILFSEFYFYLTAYIEDEKHKEDKSPTIYRVDRLISFNVLKEHFKVPYSERFREGEYRKQIQFMYGGKLKKIKFEYSGPSIEAVMDRLPEAEIKEIRDGVYLVLAECFDIGMEMWLGSQKEWVKVL